MTYTKTYNSLQFPSHYIYHFLRRLQKIPYHNFFRYNQRLLT